MTKETKKEKIHKTKNYETNITTKKQSDEKKNEYWLT